MLTPENLALAILGRPQDEGSFEMKKLRACAAEFLLPYLKKRWKTKDKPSIVKRFQEATTTSYYTGGDNPKTSDSGLTG